MCIRDRRRRFAPSTVSRSVASIRAFYQYLVKIKEISENPSESLHPPKVEKKMPEILTVEEVDLLLAQPKGNTPKGMRDRAMLELLYATGIRVSELIHLELSDVNLQLGFLTCRESGREKMCIRDRSTTIANGSGTRLLTEQWRRTSPGILLQESMRRCITGWQETAEKNKKRAAVQRKREICTAAFLLERKGSFTQNKKRRDGRY